MRHRRACIRRPCQPGGYTLLEMLLVLTVLLVVTAIVYPAFVRIYRTHRLEEQAETVRSKFAGTRVRAIDGNIIYQFLYEPGGRRFLVIPFEHDAFETIAAGQPYASEAAALRYTCSGQLPEGFELRPVDLSEPLGGKVPPEILAIVPGALELSNVRWSLPVLFYPDGTATDYAFDVLDNRSPRNYIRLKVRGLTGAVSVTEVRQEEGRYR